jgi:hypothetical protein
MAPLKSQVQQRFPQKGSLDVTKENRLKIDKDACVAKLRTCKERLDTVEFMFKDNAHVFQDVLCSFDEAIQRFEFDASVGRYLFETMASICEIIVSRCRAVLNAYEADRRQYNKAAQTCKVQARGYQDMACECKATASEYKAQIGECQGRTLYYQSKVDKYEAKIRERARKCEAEARRCESQEHQCKARIHGLKGIASDFKKRAAEFKTMMVVYSSEAICMYI